MIYRTRTAVLAVALSTASALSFAAGLHRGGHDEVAIGKPGQAASVNRTINIDMTDNMRFSMADIAVKQGETIRFLVKNSGQVKHEMVLGTAKELKEHYALMMKTPEMEHADANMVTVAPGKTGEVIWQFTKAGKVDFACLQPGHYDAGMKGIVSVAGTVGASRAEPKVDARTTTSKDSIPGMDMSGAKMVIPGKGAMPGMAVDTAATASMSDGEVRKIDKDNKKITLKHGAIKNLDMPGMTMVFQVKDASLLDKLEVSNKVKFNAENLNGAIVVTALETVK